MTHERPPQPGLTRLPTGYPSSVHPGWYLLPGEVQRQQRRSNRRVTTNGTVVEMDPDRPLRLVSRDVTPRRTNKQQREWQKQADWKRRTGERGHV